MESQGCWGPTAVETLRELASHYALKQSRALDSEEQDTVEASAGFLRLWRQKLSVALQRGNAQCILHVAHSCAPEQRAKASAPAPTRRSSSEGCTAG